MSVFLLASAVALALVWLLRRWPLGQTIAIAATMTLVGATLAARQRDGLAARHMTIRQWQQEQKTPDATTRLGRSRLFFMHQRERLLTHYQRQGVEGETYAIVAATTLGDKSAIDKDLRQAYNVSGAAHVLALSGMHIGIVYALLALVMTGRRRRIAAQVVLVVAIWGFVFLVGMPVSAVRAATMISLYALLSLGHREKTSINALAFTAIVMLVVSPLTLFDIGFQMSYMAVLSILVWMPVMERWPSQQFLQRHRLLRWVWGLTAVSVAAQAGVAPLVAYYFGRVSTYFLLTNFLVLPAVTLILWIALATLVITPLSPVLTTVVGGLNTGLRVISRLPGSSIEGLHPTLLQVLLVYGLLLCCYWMITLLSARQR
jgi:competence protein ComEC